MDQQTVSRESGGFGGTDSAQVCDLMLGYFHQCDGLMHLLSDYLVIQFLIFDFFTWLINSL